MLDTLTEKQERFVEAYFLRSGNMRQAALDAGYSQATSDHAGREIARTPSVENAIRERAQALRDEAITRLAANLPSVLDELLAMALSPDTPATAKQRALTEILDRSGILAQPARLGFVFGAAHENGLDDFLEAARRGEEGAVE